jgi:hypothetical protein
MISLSDQQLEIVMDAAAELPAEKRTLLLERVAARLRLVGRFHRPRSRVSPCAPACTTWIFKLRATRAKSRV